MNAPEAGTIKEFLANEEDTVTVGQDLVRLELGGEPSSGAKQEATETTEPASKAQETSSQPKGGQEEQKAQEGEPQPPKQESKPEPPKQESKPVPPPSKPAPPKEPKEAEPKKEGAPGSRDERRVRTFSLLGFMDCANSLFRSR